MNVFGIIGAILTTSAFVPQAIKTIKTRETKDLSVTTFTMIFIGTVCWCIYGIFIKDWLLIGANSITAFFAGIILTIILTSPKA